MFASAGAVPPPRRTGLYLPSMNLCPRSAHSESRSSRPRLVDPPGCIDACRRNGAHWRTAALPLLLTTCIAASLAAVLFSSPVQAQSMRRFRQYVTRAQQAYERGDADAAIEALTRAYEIRPVPLLLFNIARAHELAGRYDRAVEYYDRFLATDPDPEQARTAREARASAQATLDAQRRPATTTPAVSATTPSPTPASRPTPHPRPVDRPRRFTALHGTLLATGGALTAAGTVLGILALSASNEFQNTTAPRPPELQDRGLALAWGANAGIGLGLLTAAAGVLLYFIQDTRPPTEAAGGSHP